MIPLGCNIRVSCSQIDTNDFSIVFLNFIFLGVGGSEKRQRRNEDEKEVEDGGPSSERLGRAAARVTRHGECVCGFVQEG